MSGLMSAIDAMAGRPSLLPAAYGARGLARRLLGRERFERVMFEHRVGYRPNLDAPRTFNEKLSWRKLYADLPEAPLLADKLAVRERVRKLVGGEYLTELLQVAERTADVDFEALPESFVAKATHGSGFNVFVAERSRTDLAALRRELSALMSHDFGRLTNEWWYTRIPRRLIVEPLLRDRHGGGPLDYKFLVFNGRARIVDVHIRSDGGHARTFYDPDWNAYQFTRGAYRLGPKLERPAKFDLMKEISETLAGDLDFVRVDLYCLDDRDVLFGELTLAPAAGWNPFDPPEADLMVGSMWQLDVSRAVRRHAPDAGRL
jgi:hypothetical protein